MKQVLFLFFLIYFNYYLLHNLHWIYDWSSQLHTQLKQLWIKAWKDFRREWYSNPWSLRYRCSALPTELSSQLGAGHIVSSLYTHRRWRMQLNIWKIIIFELQKKLWSNDWSSQLCIQCKQLWKAWKKIQAWML